MCVAEVDTVHQPLPHLSAFLLAPVQTKYFPAAHFSTLASNMLYNSSRAFCKHQRPVTGIHTRMFSLVLWCLHSSLVFYFNYWLTDYRSKPTMHRVQASPSQEDAAGFWKRFKQVLEEKLHRVMHRGFLTHAASLILF